MVLTESIDTSVLDTLFADDWNNLYRPINITSINSFNRGCCQSGGSNSALIDEIISRQDKFEEILKTIDGISEIKDLAQYQKDVADVSVRIQNLENLSQKIDDVSVDIAEVKETQESIDNFLKSIFQWEGQDGSKIE